MLHRDNKFIIIICLIFFFASCDKYTRYDIKETKKIRTNCINKSQVLLGEEYWLVYNSAVAWCTDCTTQEDWDRKYLSIISENWSKRDTTNNN